MVLVCFLDERLDGRPDRPGPGSVGNCLEPVPGRILTTGPVPFQSFQNVPRGTGNSLRNREPV